jgi:hypothetical protein
MAAATAGRYVSPSRPSTNTPSASPADVRASASDTMAPAPHQSASTSVGLRPRRSVIQPPRKEASIPPRPQSPMTSPASALLSPRVPMRYSMRYGTTKVPARLTSVPVQMSQ